MSFSAEVQDVDQVTKQVKISIPPETFSEEFNTVIVGLMKNSNVKGFRAGKAPRHLVERLHGERVKFEVANRLISRTLYDTVREKSIDMIGEPEIDVSAIEPGKRAQFHCPNIRFSRNQRLSRMIKLLSMFKSAKLPRMMLNN